MQKRRDELMALATRPFIWHHQPGGSSAKSAHEWLHRLSHHCDLFLGCLRVMFLSPCCTKKRRFIIMIILDVLVWRLQKGKKGKE